VGPERVIGNVFPKIKSCGGYKHILVLEGTQVRNQYWDIVKVYLGVGTAKLVLYP